MPSSNPKGAPQPGDLGVLRGVFRGFSEEARIGGCWSPPLDGLVYIDVIP